MPVSPNMYTKNKTAQIIMATRNSLDDSIQDNGLINRTMTHAKIPQIAGTKITLNKFFIFPSSQFRFSYLFLFQDSKFKNHKISFGYIISRPLKMSMPRLALPYFYRARALENILK
jgi:hypothetical protein